MKSNEPGNLPLRFIRLQFRVFFNLLVQLEHRPIFSEILKDIQNIALFDGLLHGIQMECLILPLRVQPAEQAQRFILRRSREREHGHVRLLPGLFDLIVDHIIRILVLLVAGTKRLRDRLHILAGCRGMRFIYDHSEPLSLQVSHCVHDIRELLDRRRNDLRIMRQFIRQICRCTLIVHHADKSGFMIHPEDGFLQLPVNDHAVGDDDYIIEDDLIIRIMQRRQAVRQPGNAVRLAGTRRMLDQVIEVAAVFRYRSDQLPDEVQLVIPGEDDRLGMLFLPGKIILYFLTLDEDELADKVEDRILFENIFPHVRYAVPVFKKWISGTGINSFAPAHVERQEYGRLPIQLRRHIDFFQVHGEVDDAPGLKPEEPCLRIPVGTVLCNCVVI